MGGCCSWRPFKTFARLPRSTALLVPQEPRENRDFRVRWALKVKVEEEEGLGQKGLPDTREEWGHQDQGVPKEKVESQVNHKTSLLTRELVP